MKQNNFPRPMLGFVAFSGTGKTTLLEKLIPQLHQRGLRVALIKHAHHDFDIDIPGKDSYRLRQAGASQVMVASSRRWALINENDRDTGEPRLGDLLQHLDAEHFDLLLVEGFKHEKYPKIELWRQLLGKPLLYPEDKNIIALASDQPPQQETSLPRLDIDDVTAIADFVVDWMAAFDEHSPRQVNQ